MTLFGALSSGVSGLTAQSSAIGAISDNITNVSTVGYKNTQVDFQTLVTRQTSSTFFSAGGVQSRPRQDTGVQGLLSSSSSQTDIAISGNGFFVVNEASVPTINNEFLFTRAGSFFQDNEGFLRNTAGLYLQAWPTDSAGVIVPANKNLTIANLNVISTDFLTTVNLNRVGGTAAATDNIAIGANLPSNDTAGTTRKTDVQFFDTLGNATTMSLVNTKSFRDNNWDLSINPPPGTAVITIEDAAGLNYASAGQLEFQSRPADGAKVIIEGITYEFDQGKPTFLNQGSFTFDDVGETITSSVAGEFSQFEVNDKITLSGTVANNKTFTITNINPAGTVITVTDGGTSVDAEAAIAAGNVTVTYAGFVETTSRVRVNVTNNTTVAQDVSTFIARVIAVDSDFDTINNRIKVDPGNSTTVLFEEDGTGAIQIDPSGLLTTAGAPAANQDIAFTVKKQNAKYTETTQLTFPGLPAAADNITINGITYTFVNGAPANSQEIQIDGGATVASVVADLETAIETNDPLFPLGGSSLRGRAANKNTLAGAVTNDTLVIPSLASGSFNISFSTGFTNLPTEPDGTTTTFSTTSPTAVNTEFAIVFDADGIPAAFNVSKLEILNFANGSADMNDDPAAAKKITLDLGDVGEANGFTQFGGEFTPVFITQNGSQFGTFAGVTVANDGLVTALFDNGETRPVFQIPLATFVNVNALGARTGNVFNSTQQSGDPTLRIADSGPAGQVVQTTLEQSTVDIGTEFTKMIVVQRAFSAAAKIISTADEMLEELIRTKR